jgi:transposase-like protein
MYRLRGLYGLNNDYQVKHMTWHCPLCNEEVKVRVDGTYVQYVDGKCKRCNREYTLNNYLMCSN